jgi:hypothetical protein
LLEPLVRAIRLIGLHDVPPDRPGYEVSELESVTAEESQHLTFLCDLRSPTVRSLVKMIKGEGLRGPARQVEDLVFGHLGRTHERLLRA